MRWLIAISYSTNVYSLFFTYSISCDFTEINCSEKHTENITQRTSVEGSSTLHNRYSSICHSYISSWLHPISFINRLNERNRMGVSNLYHLNDITKKCALHLRCVTGNFTRFPCSEWMLTRTSRLICRKTAKLSLPEENQIVKGRNCCKHYVRKAAEHSEGEGLSFTQPCAYSYSNFPKCPLRCSVAQANLFALFTVSIESVINVWLVAQSLI